MKPLFLFQRAAWSLALAALTSCSAVKTTSAERFTETGEMIALSGGDAGATNACFTCHGIDGRGDGAGAPRLAGRGIGYLDRQLEAYASGRRRHPQMAWIANRLTPTHRLAVSAYYDAMPYEPAATPPPVPAPVLYVHGDPSRGLPACALCHGRFGEGVGRGNPPVGGQPAAYLAEQMEQWRLSKRRSDPNNIMLAISRQLTSPEVAGLAAYAAALPGDRPESPAAFP